MTTIAITGPTGTFGHGLVPLLQEDPDVERVVGIARRPFDPAERGWTKMTYRQGDVRDVDALVEAFAGADAVAHLAFIIYGTTDRATLHAVNVEGTVNAFRAAARAGVKRFVYASSVAAYGFHADNPIGIKEDWPTRGTAGMFYSQEKAEVERRLDELAAEHPDVEQVRFRPTIVVGPHAAGAGAELVPKPLRPVGAALRKAAGVLPLPVPAVIPSPVPVQLVHHDDVGQAFHLALKGEGAPGAYNLTGDGVLQPVPVPRPITRATAAVISGLPGPAALEWVKAIEHPLVVDATKAKEELGWRPRYTTADALRATLA